MLFKIFHSFADNPSHTVPQALAIASELAISLRHWSNIDNWHAECAYANLSLLTIKSGTNLLLVQFMHLLPLLGWPLFSPSQILLPELSFLFVPIQNLPQRFHSNTLLHDSNQ